VLFFAEGEARFWESHLLSGGAIQQRSSFPTSCFPASDEWCDGEQETPRSTDDGVKRRLKP
jgi:hypothetical protein